MDSRLVSERIARMEWIDTVAEPLQSTVARIYEATGKPGEWVERQLHGEFLGHPLHSIAVHLPVGAWTLAALLDPWGGSLAARQGADLAVAVGVVGALGAAVTGATDYARWSGVAVRRIGGLHATLNVLALLLYTLSWIERARGGRDLARVLSYLGFVALMGSGYLGGLMVYEKRLGVNHAPIPEDERAPEGWTPVANLVDLPEGIAYRATAGDTALVLVRRGATVDALADRCAHQGGPLSEGRVVDGCIECPWHGTRFGLATGASVAGPSVYAQPKYPVRIVDGAVEVLAKEETPAEAETLAGEPNLT